MKSKVLAALVATMAVGATCAFAANPFVDVPSDSWAYKSVVELADAGIIQGVDGSYFQGERNITRYEAAEMTAKAMAHMDKASVEQRALINKLADEYADELNNLGVRVSNLENRVGNVKLTGDARIRYRYQDNNPLKDNDNSWDYRVRLRANANVNDRTKVTYGISSNNHNFGNNDAASAGESGDNKDIYTDIAKVDYNFGGNNWNLSVGRTDAYVLGNGYGYQSGDVFDRAQLTYTSDKFRATAGYGKFKEPAGDESHNGFDAVGVKTAYGELEGFFGGGSAAGSALGVYYNDFSGNNDTTYKNRNYAADDLWGTYLSLNFGSKWNALFDYEHVNNDSDVVDDANVWVGKLKYGKASFATPKSWEVWVEYINAEDGAQVGANTNSWRFGQLDNIKSWGIGGSYVVAKNARFNAYQSFSTQTKEGNEKDPEEQTRAEFVFAF